MITPVETSKQLHSAYLSYVVGFGLSIATTLLAYWITVSKLLTGDGLVYGILGIAVVQLVVQMVYFLHLGQGSRWKLLTFIFTVIFVLIIVVGTVWVMHHLNYNMMDMSPGEMSEYMNEHEGI